MGTSLGMFFVGLVTLIVLVFLMRMIGAWMLRIDEVIKELKTIQRTLVELGKSINRNSEKNQLP